MASLSKIVYKAKTKVLTKAEHKNLVILIKEMNIGLLLGLLLEKVSGRLQQTL